MKEGNHIHLRLGLLIHKIRLVCMLRGEQSMGRYIRSCVERCIEQDMKEYPDARLTMRPQSIVYKMDEIGGERVFTALTRTIGGERCWVISSLDNLPASAGGEPALLVDITTMPGRAGCDARNVVVPVSSVLGASKTRREKMKPIPPGVTDGTDAENHL